MGDGLRLEAEQAVGLVRPPEHAGLAVDSSCRSCDASARGRGLRSQPLRSVMSETRPSTRPAARQAVPSITDSPLAAGCGSCDGTALRIAPPFIEGTDMRGSSGCTSWSRSPSQIIRPY